MREYIRIVESMLLEYLVAAGETPDAMMNLNVFVDLLEDQDGYEESGIPAKLKKKYSPIATAIVDRVENLPPFPLLPDMVDLIEEVWYDGSDVYEPDYVKELAGIYDQQLAACAKICDEIDGYLADKEKARPVLVKAVLRMAKRNSLYTREVIEGLRNCGFDYPELGQIEQRLSA